jgi:hypothetical protein
VPAGVRVNGIDVGTWLKRQTTPAGWAQLTDGQRQLLEQLGVPAPAPLAKGDGRAPVTVRGLEQMDSFARGIAAGRQYLAREGHLTVPRTWVEELHPALEDGTSTVVVPVRLGVFLSNQKSRRSRLTEEKLRQLADLGLHWAQTAATTTTADR